MNSRTYILLFFLFFFKLSGCNNLYGNEKNKNNKNINVRDTNNEDITDVNLLNEVNTLEVIPNVVLTGESFCDKIKEAQNDVELPSKAKKPYFFSKEFSKCCPNAPNKPISEEISIYSNNGKEYKFQIFDCENLSQEDCEWNKIQFSKLKEKIGKLECRCISLRLTFDGKVRWLALQCFNDILNLKIKKHKLLNEEVIIVSGAVPDGVDKKNRLILRPEILIIRIDNKRNNAYVYLQIQLFTGNGMEPSDKKLDLCDPEYECDIKVVDTDGNKKGEFLIKGKGDQCAILKCRETIADIGYESCTGTIHGGPQDGEEMWAFMNLYDEELDWLLLFMPQ